ncbi:MAG: M23 family metallopeptidase [Myxococcaceae bacterium]|nr:M23 family metallopeptidase [Myxococcaceae bacterium]
MRVLPLACALLGLGISSLADASTTRILNRRIERDETLAHALYALQLSGNLADAIIGALQGTDFDFRRVRPGDQFRVVCRDGQVDFFDFRQSTERQWTVRRDGDRFVGMRRAVEVEKQIATVELAIDTSLWDAAIAAGEDPDIAVALADVFAWDVDFYRDVRTHDRVRAVIEKFVSKGRLLRYGEVLAASYEGAAVGRKRVFRYELEPGRVSYFQQDGSSARKTFLKSPLKYAHITSRYGMRFHPVLKYQKAHNGVDYGTPIGTPVWAVADGTVTRAGHFGANGNLVCVRHMNAWETCYAHLSKVMVSRGQRVVQKQVIALSGNTGRSTGPHVHFALKRNGAFVNPLTQNFPRAEPLPKDKLPDFEETIAPWVRALDATPVATLAATATP